jgi:hypothetical protein
VLLEYLLQELEPLGAELGRHQRKAGDVAARTRKARDDAVADGVGAHRHHDRDRARRVAGRQHRRRREGDEHVDLHFHELCRKRRHVLELAFAPADLEPVILALGVTELAHPLPETFEAEIGVVLGDDRRQVADHLDFLLLAEHTYRSNERCGQRGRS